ncbi:tripartite tricarboxylate transporter substrate binding protein [Prauserella cavernicola]|uniref:Tripartite tricarboxylate transporter substrate binding protein n=1 Tax=Prauserella cavernicola TaxID=2800127 RepID=A0A934V9K2_9PSEU|nr:tripartite tricarboxylate transporter substrate binding protein [Prauserella cavernicola]MBK1789430.1 tripartite tricarboxylate transporter substrate binding protein [Prauserella cavernicola]
MPHTSRRRRPFRAGTRIAAALLAVPAVASCAVGPGGISGDAPVDPASYPAGSIEVVVPYEAGGATDQMVRLITDPVAENMGAEALVVLNQPGGAGTIGTTRVVAASPDGYTLGFVAGGPLTVQPHYGRTIYSPDDLTPVARVGVSPIVLAVRADAPWRTVEDLITSVRAEPGSVRYASTGAGNPANLAMERLDNAAGVDTTQVPFESSAEAVTALLGGNVEAAAGSPSGFAASVRSGDLRILANLGSVKGEGYENVPTLRESGYDVATDITSGFIAPGDLPDTYRDKLAEAVRTALENPELRDKFATTGAVPRFGGPGEYAADIAREYEQTGEALHAAGLL